MRWSCNELASPALHLMTHHRRGGRWHMPAPAVFGWWHPYERPLLVQHAAAHARLVQ